MPLARCSTFPYLWPATTVPPLVFWLHSSWTKLTPKYYQYSQKRQNTLKQNTGHSFVTYYITSVQEMCSCQNSIMMMINLILTELFYTYRNFVSGKDKAKLSLYLIIKFSTMPWRHIREWRYSLTILNLGTRWRWVVSFKPQPLYSWGFVLQYPLDRRLGGSQSQFGHYWENKNFLS
jgi:hypothetical protein